MLLELQNISKSYRKRKSKERVKAVSEVSFNVKEGEIVGLLGPNGAGKTTTIKMICGLITPDSGMVNVRGFDVQRERLKAMRHISAVLEGNRNLYWRLSVQENLEYFAGNRGRSRRQVRQRIDELLTLFHLGDKRTELVNNLSRGMQQKLAIAVAMLADTELVLLDEPTLGLDVETGYEVRELLRLLSQQGRTVLISTHDMPVVQDLCERVVIISGGQLVANDRVSNLLDLFTTKAYEVTLGTPLSHSQETRLRQVFSICQVAETKRSLSVTMDDNDALYTLMDILRAEHTVIEAIDRSTINFETVFRQIVNGRAADVPEVRHAVA
jgi:ABC-2 type transport system ATP-binding protein